MNRKRICLLFAFCSVSASQADTVVPIVNSEGQPLGANAIRLVQALDYLGHSLPEAAKNVLRLPLERETPKRFRKHLMNMFCSLCRSILKFASKSHEGPHQRSSNKVVTLHTS